jgi:hypothetical protein
MRRMRQTHPDSPFVGTNLREMKLRSGGRTVDALHQARRIMPAPDDPLQNGIAILFSSVEDEVRHAASRRSCIFENASINFEASISTFLEKTGLTAKTPKIAKTGTKMPRNRLKTPRTRHPLVFRVRGIWQGRPPWICSFFAVI